MQPYRNLSGNSGVMAFEIGANYIKVQFNKGAYTYSYGSAGQRNIEEMKILAIKGKGLNTFIDVHVKKRYVSKY